MISAPVLAACYVLFIITLYTGKPDILGFDRVWFVVIWSVHILYYVSLSLLRKYLPFSILDRIGEKSLRKVCNVLGPVGGEGCELLFAFFIFAALFVFGKPIILRENPAIPTTATLFLVSVLAPMSFLFVSAYLHRYLNLRLRILDDHRNKKRSWSAYEYWKENAPDVDERKKSARRLCAGVYIHDNMPDDVVDASGNKLLSWRVLFALKTGYSFGSPDKPLDMTQNWDAPGNLAAAIPKPTIYFYPEESPDEMRTCVVRIKEIHEWVKTTGRRNQERGMKAYLVLLSPENAVPWTQPFDVSWRDLASGDVKLYDRKPIVFAAADGKLWTTDALPDTLEGWKTFLGIDEAVEAVNAKSMGSPKNRR